MKKHFTLIELIVVIAIIAILAAIIAPNAFKAIEKAKISKAAADSKTFKTAILALYADTGHWPGDGGITNEVGVYLDPNTDNLPWPPSGLLHPSNLIEDDNGWSGWDGPYVEKLLAKTPWAGTYFLYRRNDNFLDEPWRYYIYMMFHGACYPTTDPPDFSCGVPDNSAKKIDDTLDDGNVTSGSGMFFNADTVWPTLHIHFWALAPVR
ncbi:MAG: type II secretion system protein GspG [Candidatus Omnitrophica bacterium]|nr:type II secretion system protein GspG [Candidatus Omnitrophota bacterium]